MAVELAFMCVEVIILYMLVIGTNEQLLSSCSYLKPKQSDSENDNIQPNNNRKTKRLCYHLLLCSLKDLIRDSKVFKKS